MIDHLYQMRLHINHELSDFSRDLTFSLIPPWVALRALVSEQKEGTCTP